MLILKSSYFFCKVFDEKLRFELILCNMLKDVGQDEIVPTFVHIHFKKQNFTFCLSRDSIVGAWLNNRKSFHTSTWQKNYQINIKKTMEVIMNQNEREDTLSSLMNEAFLCLRWQKSRSWDNSFLWDSLKNLDKLQPLKIQISKAFKFSLISFQANEAFKKKFIPKLGWKSFGLKRFLDTIDQKLNFNM